MNDKAIWETPEIEALTDSGSKADHADIAVRNGGFPPPSQPN
jgi:hypothetical protein